MNEIVILPAVRKTPQMLEIEQKYEGEDIRWILKRLYESTGSQAEVAKVLEVEQSTIFQWALRLGMIFTNKPIAEIREPSASLAA